MPVINTTMQGAALTVDASGGVPSTATYSGGLALRSDGALYTAPIGGNTYDPRTLVIGDSHLQMGWANNADNLGRFTVNGGVATMQWSGSHNIAPGNKFTLIDPTNAATLDTCAMSYAELTALTVPDNNTVTVSATVNGLTMPNGTAFHSMECLGSTSGNTLTVSSVVSGTIAIGQRLIGAGFTAAKITAGSGLSWTFNGPPQTVGPITFYGSQFWLAIPSQNQRDSSFLHSINGWNGAPFVFTHNFTANGTSSAQHLAALPKVQAQAPKSTYANVVISLGTNPSVAGQGMYQQATLATAIAAAETEYRNIMAIADALYSSGTVYIVIPIGGSTGSSNTANFTRAVGYLRRKFLQTRRPYRLRFFDLFGLSVDGSDASGLMAANYTPASGNNHLSTFGNYRIAKQQTEWDSRLGWDTANRYAWKPISYLDDNTNAVTSWAASTSYTVGAVRMNNYTVYQCVAITGAGTSASSGGPTGDGTASIDNQVTWSSLGPAAVNLVQNGLMQGTGGTNSAAFAGATTTVPTGWALQSATNVTLASCATAGNSAITVKPTGTDSTPGFGWDLSIAYTAAVGVVTCYQNCPLMLRGGSWYQARMTVTGKTALNTVLAAVALRCQPTFTGIGTFNVSAMTAGNNTSTIPLDTTDSYEVVTAPFFVPASLGTSSNNQIYIEIQSNGTAGTVNLQLSNIAYYPVRDPAAIPA